MAKTAKRSPTARALAELRKQGYCVAITERWNQYAKVRQDLFGFIDLIYLTAHTSVILAGRLGNIVAVQVTSGNGGHHANRKAKILAEPRALKWLQSGGLIELWSYSKQGGRGKRKLWTLRKEEIVAEDFRRTT